MRILPFRIICVYFYKFGCMKRINVDIDDELIQKAMAMSGMKTKKELVNAALDYYWKVLKSEEVGKVKRAK